jgi:Leucine-rich repeat (LRR) protein
MLDNIIELVLSGQVDIAKILAKSNGLECELHSKFDLLSEVTGLDAYELLTAKSISLRGKRLLGLPPSIQYLKNLQFLDLRGNRLDRIDENIFKNLTYVHIKIDNFDMELWEYYNKTYGQIAKQRQDAQAQERKTPRYI